MQPTHMRNRGNKCQHLFLQKPRLGSQILIHKLKQLLIRSAAVNKATKALQLLGVSDAQQRLIGFANKDMN